jgi:uncharacterized membrane protein
MEHSAMSTFREWVDVAGLIIDATGVAVIGGGLFFAVLRFGFHAREGLAGYQRLRQDIGRGILLGLEFLVAADIVRTVAVEPTLDGVLVLGLIVLVRTFLSLSLQVELEGRLPWRRNDGRA